MSCRTGSLTLVLVNDGKQLDEQIRAAAGHMNKGTLFTQPHARSHGQTLRDMSDTRHEQVQRSKEEVIPIQGFS